MFRLFAGAVLVAPLISPAIAQAEPRYSIEHPARGLTIVRDVDGSNSVLLEGAQAIVIDTQPPGRSAALDAALKSPVAWIVNTHEHEDHKGGNAHFLAAGAKLQRGGDASRDWRKAASLKSGRWLLKILSVPPAHTGADRIVVIAPADIVLMGDLFVNLGAFPYLDAAAGADVRGLVPALDAALQRIGEKTLVVPGHGPLARRAQLVAWRDMVAEIIDGVAKAKAQGRSLEAVQALGLARKWETNKRPAAGLAAEAFIAAAYKNLP